ncbi:MAG: MmcQ/YjbR family DNA-binding protein [Bacteroidia bacterium]|nr:MmcQ/YjbR family DNA-binding protein [Bacteroidia bacterium]
MIHFTTLRETALSFPEETEEPHVENLFFRVNKKIFVSYDESRHRTCIKLSEIDQNVFSEYDNTLIFSVPGAWGKQGWTFIDMKQVPEEMFADALQNGL